MKGCFKLFELTALFNMLYKVRSRKSRHRNWTAISFICRFILNKLGNDMRRM